jgi:ATP diphosphatase
VENLKMRSSTANAQDSLGKLLEVMRRLRDPVDGCPWDLQQNHKSIAPYTIEEAYEAADAIEREDYLDLRDELGDILLQVVFQAQIAQEDGKFAFSDIAEAITAKMHRRHPHVFPDENGAIERPNPGNWERIKAEERQEKIRNNNKPSAIDGIARTLPPQARALKLQKRAARIGFDFPDWHSAFAKTQEEMIEVIKAVHEGKAELFEEVGDLIFSVINTARKLGTDPDAALEASNHKFERRFKAMEIKLEQDGKDPAAVDLPTQDEAWNLVKKDQSLLRR